MSQDGVYGYPCVTNPNDFTPDVECCSSREIETHKTACANWGKPSYEPNKGCYTERSEDGQIVKHVTRTSWGIGFNSFTKCDACEEVGNETIHCWECGGDFCCASCWPKHDAEDCRP